MFKKAHMLIIGCVIGVLGTMAVVSALHQNTITQKSFGWVEAACKRASVIKITEPMLDFVDTVPEGKDILELSLVDVAKYSGHVCGGIASGYLITQEALKELYPKGTPVRGQIDVTASMPNDLLDVASYITGARTHYGKTKINSGDLKVDPSLAAHGEVVIEFRRRDNGRTVRARWSKHKMLSVVKNPKRLREIKEKVENGSATPEEKRILSTMIQKVTNSVLSGTVVPFTVEVVR